MAMIAPGMGLGLLHCGLKEGLQRVVGALAEPAGSVLLVAAYSRATFSAHKARDLRV